jgi:5-methylcytosine-specific restriction endonuclease McrA
MTVSDASKKLVRERAKYLCEYSHALEEASAALFAIYHIIPQSFPNSSDNPDNLALACQLCNGYRYNFMTGIDPETGKNISIFNPRKQRWSDHFIWSADGLRIIGMTDTGRTTCNRLDLNDDRHNDGSIVKARRLWVKGGWHSPEEDPGTESEI